MNVIFSFINHNVLMFNDPSQLLHFDKHYSTLMNNINIGY